jgi:hypothetical protein
MKELLMTRGKLSDPGLDEIINPLLKLEREKEGKMLIELTKMITNTSLYPGEWKNARTILLIRKEKEAIQGIGERLQLQVSFIEKYFVE